MVIGRAVHLVTGRRSKVLVLILFAVLAGGLASQSGKLSEVTSSDLAATLPDGAESLQVVRATEQLGDRVTPAIVVYRREAPPTPRTSAAGSAPTAASSAAWRSGSRSGRACCGPGRRSCSCCSRWG